VLANVLRRSCRRYRSDAPGISLEVFSSLLAWAFLPLAALQGPAPAGAVRYWIVVLAVEGLSSGVWHYDPASHSLGPCHEGSYRKECQAVCLGQELGRDASFLVFHTSVLSEAVEAMGERAYRPLCMEAGMVGERLNLAAQALGLGSSGIGGYFDDLGNQLLERPLDEALLYISTVGVPA
jgi:SagB-type dehydrogenase family enzyme